MQIKNHENYVPKKAKIIFNKQMTKDTVLLRIDFKIKHEPGQFVQVGLLGIGECPISICSYSENYIELCIRSVGDLTKKLCALKTGDEILIRGPYGNGYPMKEFFKKDIVLIGGGTGVAPLIGVIKYIEKNRKKFGKIDIFFGFKTPADVLFKEEIEEWMNLPLICIVPSPKQKNKPQCMKDFKAHLTVDQTCLGWTCNIGIVTNVIEKENLSKDAKSIICGPPMMLKSTGELLIKKGIKEKNIYTSLERRMSCGIGKCGRCMINTKYVCKHGPVFNFVELKTLKD